MRAWTCAAIPFSRMPPTLQSRTARRSSGRRCWPGWCAATASPRRRPADHTTKSHSCVVEMSNVTDRLAFSLEQKRTVAEEPTVLTFRKVALSLVTMDGLTLMLSCMINVKLQNKQGVKEKNNIWLTEMKIFNSPGMQKKTNTQGIWEKKKNSQMLPACK